MWFTACGKKRDKDTFFKRSTAQGFYKLMKLLGVEVVYNHADYRLDEPPCAGRAERVQGGQHLSARHRPQHRLSKRGGLLRPGRPVCGGEQISAQKMLSFALDGITSFSVKPLKIISNLGIVISVLSVLGLIYALVAKLTGVAVAGWTAIIGSIWLLGGIQLLCLGIIGEYIGKIYSESKHRPRFTIEELLKK